MKSRAPRSSCRRVEHLGAKEALLADAPGAYFTTPHGPEDLRELIVEAWLARAPKRLARDYLDAR